MRELLGALLHGMVYRLVVMFSYHPLFAKSRHNTNILKIRFIYWISIHIQCSQYRWQSPIFSRNAHLESRRKLVRGCCNLIRHQTDKHPINSTRYLKYEFGRRQLCVPSMPMERTHRSGHSLQRKVFVRRLRRISQSKAFPAKRVNKNESIQRKGPFVLMV